MANNFTNGKNGAGAGPGKDDDKKIFIGGLSRNISDKEVREYFENFGDISIVDIKMDPYTQQSRGFGFVQFGNTKTVDSVLSQEDHYIGSKKIDVKRVSKKVNPLKYRIFVGGLTHEITEGDIKTYFSQYGTITDFQQPFDKAKNIKKGFCFITFEDAEQVKLALANPKQILGGKEVDVKKVKYNPETMGGPGGRPLRPATPYYGTRTAYVGYGVQYPQGYGYPTNAYEAYGPAYAGYDYSALGYTDSVYGSQSYSGGKYRDTPYQRPTPY